ncbi:MAG: 2-oxo acid dehydrogenase subunit E2 [Alphaproteobacteria bacterium]|nr:2-oxo acid dehydrogenase subunit E2 [Alphaproteobacteria bacterium]
MSAGGDEDKGKEGAAWPVKARRVAPLPPMQKMAAAHLARSHQETAPVTLLGEIDAENLLALIEGLNAGKTEGDPARIGVTPLLVKAIAAALVAHPALNVGLIEGKVHHWAEINVGVAMGLPDGNLIVPVIRDADRKTPAAIAAEIAELEGRARSGRLGLAEVRGGTFTLSNAGMAKSARWTTPIIPLPQCAILGVGRIRPTAVAREGAVVARRTIPTSLTFDHRLVNGLPASLFLDTLFELIETPSRLDLGGTEAT